MKAIRSSALALALVVPLAVPGAAQAQPAAPTFEAFAAGTPTAVCGDGEKVLETEAAYRSFLGDLPAGASPDFGIAKGKHVILAVRRNGLAGTPKIEIKRMRLAGGEGSDVIVDFETTGSKRHPMATVATSDTFVAVKVARPSDLFARFTFRDVTRFSTFKSLGLETRNLLWESYGDPKRTFSIDEAGKMSLTHPGVAEPVTGELTADELADLKSKWKAAQIADLPDAVSPIHFGGVFQVFELASDHGGSANKIFGQPGLYVREINERFKPLMDLLYAFEARLAARPLKIAGEVHVRRDTVNGDVVIVEVSKGGKVTWLHVPSSNEPFHSKLKKLEKKPVTVSARRLLDEHNKPTIRVLGLEDKEESAQDRPSAPSATPGLRGRLETD